VTTVRSSDRINQLTNLLAHVADYLQNSTWAERLGDPEICDFVVGNPHEMPLPGFTDALKKQIDPQNKDWFAYKQNETPARETVASSLSQRRDLSFNPEDIFLTNGAFAGLSVTLTAVTDPGDEVIFISPPWFFYEALIAAAGATPVRVRCDPESFDLDLEAIGDAISERTRAIIVNTPNNPTGKIYPAETLQGLADLLQDAGEENGRPIYLLSDEAYCRIIYDDRDFPSPTEFYPRSFLIYTYGKTLLTPGQRLGYVAMPPSMPGRDALRQALYTAQLVNGFAFPNALLQHALPDLEALSIDVEHLQEKRDWLVRELREAGYELHAPEGTFYLLVRSPLSDDRAFLKRLEAHDVFCLPGSLVECPGYFRISLTANDAMIERALPGFREAREVVAQAVVG
jgi:aspartate aminotransferase